MLYEVITNPAATLQGKKKISGTGKSDPFVRGLPSIKNRSFNSFTKEQPGTLTRRFGRLCQTRPFFTGGIKASNQKDLNFPTRFLYTQKTRRNDLSYNFV